MSNVVSTNPRTGATAMVGVPESTRQDVEAAGVRAGAAAAHLAGSSLEWRAGLLEAMADALEADGPQIVAVADEETALGEARLGGELRRTCFQLRFFASAVRDGGFLEASVDHAYDSAMGPLPDLRRQLEPLGPVGVFGASNFPLAFSVPGGDTASALAAGCPVIVKAHPAHPRTSLACFSAMARAAAACGAPEGTLQLVFGLDAGLALVQDENVRAVGFTGSYRAGRALFDLAQARPTPIPFYGELGSVNPLVVSPRAAAARGASIGEGLAASVTLGSGQFCTKPGLVFVPDGAGGDALVDAARVALEGGAGATMLSSDIRDRFTAGVSELLGVPDVELVARSIVDTGAAGADAVLVTTGLATLRGAHRAALETECFGAVAVIVRYDDASELLSTLASIEPALTFTLHVERDDPLAPALVALGRTKAGRVLVNGFPTGVGVSWSMHHGGPLPAATSSLHTSVGGSALRRWLRPVAYQSMPDEWLPEALQEANPLAIPRRVDGVFTLASGSAASGE
jgi:NADP-dependent aldehyde dehydrogenase